MKMELEKIGSRHRDSTNHFAAESEALDQIAKEVSEFDSKLYFQQLNWVEFIIFNLSKKIGFKSAQIGMDKIFHLRI